MCIQLHYFIHWYNVLICTFIILIEDSFFVCHWANGLESLIVVKMKSDQNVSALVQKALPHLTSGGVSESEVTVKLEGKEIEKSTKLFHLLNAASESLPLELSWSKRSFKSVHYHVHQSPQNL